MESSESISIDAQAVGIARSFHTVVQKYSNSDLYSSLWDETGAFEQSILIGAIKTLLVLEVIEPGQNATERLPFVGAFDREGKFRTE